jgi:hypothetical protein
MGLSSHRLASRCTATQLDTPPRSSTQRTISFIPFPWRRDALLRSTMRFYAVLCPASPRNAPRLPTTRRNTTQFSFAPFPSRRLASRCTTPRRNASQRNASSDFFIPFPSPRYSSHFTAAPRPATHCTTVPRHATQLRCVSVRLCPTATQRTFPVSIFPSRRLASHRRRVATQLPAMQRLFMNR